MSDGNQKVLMAEVGRPHGIRGEVRLKAYCEDPMALADYGPLSDETGRAFEILSLKPSNTVVIARLGGISTREAAEALTGTALFVDRARLPDGTLEDDEFFQADLLGMKVVDGTAKDYGSVVGVHNFGGGDILEIRKQGASSIMIPFTGDAVTDIDFDRGAITVSPVEAGLTDSEDGPGSRRRRPPGGRGRKAGGKQP
jgi:16S rRNA processing protein RimM